MSPPVSYATIELSHPLFTAEFDPYNRGYLVVGGGGGESKTGVANKIHLLDVSSRAKITSAAEIDLSRDEDSVQSLASLATKDGLITFAGINGSTSDLEAGKNEHFRSFSITFPKSSDASDTSGKVDQKKEDTETSNGSITSTGRASMFTPVTGSSGQPYQRLTKLSPINSRNSVHKRVGAIATGMAKECEIFLFDATSSAPTRANIFARLQPTRGDEAVDVDLVTFNEGSFGIAYCTDYEVSRYEFKYDFDKKSHKHDMDGKSHILYTTPQTEPHSKTQRPKFRSLRWLGQEHLVLLQNKAGKGSSELLIVRIPSTDHPGTLLQRKTLPSSLGTGLDMDICVLDSDPATKTQQIILAVLGKSQSICVLTVDYLPAKKSLKEKFSKLDVFTTLRDVHPTPITRVAFSKFFTPRQAEDSNVSIATSIQYVQLASTALGGTVVVESLALTTTPTSPSETSNVSGKTSIPAVRWILSSGSTEFLRTGAGLVTIAMVVLVTAILLQGYLHPNSTNSFLSEFRNKLPTFEPPGALPPHLRPGALSESVKVRTNDLDSDSPAAVAAAAARAAGGKVGEIGKKHNLRDLISKFKHKSSNQHIVIRPGSESESSGALAASVHADTTALLAAGAKKFEDLSAKDRETWKKRLSAAGQWSADEGETVLKGIFFSQVAEIVGGALRDAVLH